MQSVHGRSERKLIVLNDLNQPIGPTDKIVKELGSFLDTLARNSTLFPLNIHNWKKLNIKENMWKYIKTKYDIHDDGKEWVFRSIQNSWRRYRCWLNKNYYEAYANDELRMAKKSTYVSEAEFKYLLEYWKSDKVQQTSKTYTENKKKLKNPHCWKNNFCYNSRGSKKRKETSDAPSSKDMVVATRSRKPGRVTRNHMKTQCAKLLKWSKYKLKKLKMITNQLTHLQQSWDLNIQVA